MGFGSIWPWIVVLVVVVLLFGRGRVSDLMGDVAKGMKSFKKGLSDDDQPSRPIEHAATETANARTTTDERTRSNAG